MLRVIRRTRVGMGGSTPDFSLSVCFEEVRQIVLEFTLLSSDELTTILKYRMDMVNIPFNVYVKKQHIILFTAVCYPGKWL